MEANKSPVKINWTNTLFLTITPLVAILGTLCLAVTHSLHWPTIVLTIAYIFATGLSITAGYHRLFAHRTYRAAWPVRLFFLLFGAAAFQGSVLEWSTDHRKHHLYTDQEKDPYNINKGFWYAHMGWLFTLDPNKRDYKNVQDLAADPLITFQHRFIIPLMILFGFIVPMGIAALWHDALGGLILAGALRLTLNHHFTFFINSLCHFFGKRTYTDRFSARDSWIMSLFTYGEGYHNFHHQFAADYRNGIRIFHFDPTKWLIYSLSLLKLSSNLRRVNQKAIIQRRLEMEEKRLRQSNKYPIPYIEEVLHPVRNHIKKLQDRFDTLKQEYEELKKNHIDAMKEHIKDYKTQINDYRHRLKTTKKEIRMALKMWSRTIQNISLAGYERI